MKLEANKFATIDSGLRCREARELERRGEYEAARAALAGIFPARIGDEPIAEGLTEDVRAEVYLRCGVIAGFIASARGIATGQEAARRLLDYACGLYETLNDRDKESEALTAMAITYWREGNLDQAHQLLERAAIRASSDEPKALAAINRAIIFDTEGAQAKAISLLGDVAPLINENNHYVAGIYYNTLSICYPRIGESQNRPECFQISIIHSTGACWHFERLGHRRYLARAENVLGNLYRSTHQYEAAQEHLSQALCIAETLKDRTLAGQIYDTIAETYCDEGKLDEAERAARAAIRLLEDSGERLPLAEAYETLARILRSGNSL